MTSSSRFKGRSFSSAARQEKQPIVEPEELMTKDIERTDSWERAERERDIRQGMDLATTLERIEKNFVITDPRLPDNPIVRKNFQYYFSHQLNFNSEDKTLVSLFSCKLHREPNFYNQKSEITASFLDFFF